MLSSILNHVDPEMDYTILMKKAEKTPYIRRLQLTPEPACVMATEQHLKDVKRFCTSKIVLRGLYIQHGLL